MLITNLGTLVLAKASIVAVTAELKTLVGDPQPVSA